MELENAREIIGTLAQGIHPVTGEVMPEDSPYNAPDVIRALFAVGQVLDAQPAKPRRAPPPNAGKPWSPDDDAWLQARFAEQGELGALSKELGRSRWAVESRLIRLGCLPARGWMSAKPDAAAAGGA